MSSNSEKIKSNCTENITPHNELQQFTYTTLKEGQRLNCTNIFR